MSESKKGFLCSCPVERKNITFQYVIVFLYFNTKVVEVRLLNSVSMTVLLTDTYRDPKTQDNGKTKGFIKLFSYDTENVKKWSENYRITYLL